MIYHLGRFLCRIALGIFYRRIEVEGFRKGLEAGPTLFLPNHPNGLVDPLFIMILLNRRVSMTGKSTLFKIPVLGWLMRAFQVVPIFRKQDRAEGVDPSKNVDSLAELRRRLAQGGAVILFPEGTTHSRPQLERFRYGAARVALDYMNDPERGENLKIVPVGLLFGHKQRFRSLAAVRFGEPIDVAAWMRENPEGEHPLLTTEIERRVRGLTLNFERRRESVLINWAAEIFATGGDRPAVLGAERPSVAGHVGQVEALQDGYEKLQQTHGDKIDELSNRVRLYRGELRKLGIAPAEVYLPMHPAPATRFIAREMAIMIVGAPAALWGGLNHVIPYAIVRAIARRFVGDPVEWATLAIYASLPVFSIFYALQITLAFLFFPSYVAALYTVTLPLFGLIAVQYLDRAGGVWRRSATFVRLAREPELRKRLKDEGRAIIEGIEGLAAELETSRSPDSEA